MEVLVCRNMDKMNFVSRNLSISIGLYIFNGLFSFSKLC